MNNFKSLLIPISVFFITFIFSGYFSIINTDPHDGFVLKPSIDVVNGKMLFKDTFTQYGALTTILQASAIKIFGEYLIVIKLLTAFFYGLISVLIYIIWSMFLTKRLAIFSWLIWLMLSPYLSVVFHAWSSVYALFFQCLTLYFLLKYFNTKNKKVILLAGILGGLTFWCKQNVGGYTILASIISILIIQYLEKKKISVSFLLVLRYLSGTVLISIPIFLWLIVNDALNDWWKQSISFALFWAESQKFHFFNHLFPRSIGNISIWSLIPSLTIIALLKELFAKKPNLIILTVSIFGLFSWLQYYPIADIRHTYWAATPMLGITIYLFFKLSESINKKNIIIKYSIFILLFMLIFARDLYFGVKSGFIKATADYKYLEEPLVLKGMKLSESEYVFYKNTYNDIVRYIDLHGKTNLITTGANALYLTFVRSENFHPLFINIDIINNSLIYPDYLEKLNTYIEEKNTLIIAVEKKIPDGYCRVNKFVNPEDSAFLIAPCQ